MTRSLALGLAVGLATTSLAFAPTPSHAFTKQFSGKTMGLFADNPTTVQGGTFTATIIKGKKKNVLIIESTVTVFGGGTDACLTEVRVNGVLAFPSTGFINVACTPTSASGSQTLTATYWLDIDDAEAGHPGVFYGQPLNVVVKTNTDAIGQVGSISVVARMEKK